jgi:hypothetical protein
MGHNPQPLFALIRSIVFVGLSLAAALAFMATAKAAQAPESLQTNPSCLETLLS